MEPQRALMRVPKRLNQREALFAQGLCLHVFALIHEQSTQVAEDRGDAVLVAQLLIDPQTLVPAAAR